MANRVGKQIGKYELIRLLGRGGFGDVYLGMHVDRKTQAAVKILKESISNLDDLKQFIREAGNFRLQHAHIVPLREFDLDENDIPYLVMDYAPNGSLRDRYSKGTCLPLDTIVTYVRQVADALQYAHDQGRIHRDLKPENILLGPNKEVLLSDFGIAIDAHSTSSLLPQQVIGSPRYMAPEQSLGKPDLPVISIR